MVKMVELAACHQRLVEQLHCCNILNSYVSQGSTVRFMRATACNATHSIARPLCPPVCLSVKRVYCDKTKETCAQILIPHERFTHPSFLTRKTWKKVTVGGGDHYYLEF